MVLLESPSVVADPHRLRPLALGLLSQQSDHDHLSDPSPDRRGARHRRIGPRHTGLGVCHHGRRLRHHLRSGFGQDRATAHPSTRKRYHDRGPPASSLRGGLLLVSRGSRQRGAGRGDSQRGRRSLRRGLLSLQPPRSGNGCSHERHGCRSDRGHPIRDPAGGSLRVPGPLLSVRPQP